MRAAVLFSLPAAVLGMLRGLQLAGAEARLLLEEVVLPFSVPLPRALVEGCDQVRGVAVWASLARGPLVVLATALVVTLLHRLNPRLLAPVGEAEGLATKLDMRSIVCALPPVAASVGAAGAVTHLVAALAPPSAPVFVAAAAVGGATLLTLMSPGGPWGHFRSLAPERPTEQWSLAQGLVTGALMGLILGAACQPDPLQIDQDVVQVARRVADFDGALWRWVPALFAASAASVAFCAAGALWSLARLETPWRVRIVELIPALTVALAMAACIRIGYGRIAVGRYDLDRSLARAVGAQQRALEPRTIVTVPGRDKPVFIGVAPRHTAANLGDDEPTQRAMREFLARRGGRTVLAARAYRHLQDCALLAWDQGEALRLGLAAAETTPTVEAQMSLVGLLTTAAPTPDAQAVLDALCAEGRFASPSPQSQLRLGSLLWRVGRKDEALAWWRRAGPASEAWDTLAGGPAPFARGRVSGRLLWNGEPAPGVRVGLVPEWAASGLAGPVRPADQAIIGPAATTDADGRFVLEHVLEGRHALALAVEEERRAPREVLAGFSSNFESIQVDGDRPDVELGDIGLETERVPEAARPRRGRGGGI